MMHQGKCILITGLFSKDNNTSNYISSPQQLADLFKKNDIPVIQTAFAANRFLRLIQIIYAIVKNRKRFNIAIVPLYGTRPAFLLQEASARILQMLNKEIFIVLHGGSIPEQMENTPLPFLKAMKRAKTIITPSAYLQNAIKSFGLKSLVIENVLPLSTYPFINKKVFRPKLIWMRAFEETYNPEMAVRIAHQLSRKYKDFKMVMAGADQGSLSAIKQLVKNYDLTEKIIFPGYINKQQKISFAHDFDIYICTNRIDNAPVSIIEFMALGVPVVSVKTGGIPYLINNNHNGLLVNPDDDEAMISKIELLLKNTDFALAICKNAYEYSRKYNEDIILKKWKDVLCN